MTIRGKHNNHDFTIASASQQFLEDINKYFNNTCNISKTQSKCLKLRTNKISTLHHIYFLLYNDNGFYLKRKKDIFNKTIIDFPIPAYSSKYIGVSKVKRRKPYIAFLRNNKKGYRLGSYYTEIEAAQAYNNKIDELGLDKKKNIIED